MSGLYEMMELTWLEHLQMARAEDDNDNDDSYEHQQTPTKDRGQIHHTNQILETNTHLHT